MKRAKNREPVRIDRTQKRPEREKGEAVSSSRGVKEASAWWPAPFAKSAHIS